MLTIQDLNQALTISEREPANNFSEEILEQGFASWINPELNEVDCQRFLESYGWNEQDVKRRLLSTSPRCTTSTAWIDHLNALNEFPSISSEQKPTGPFQFGAQSLPLLPFEDFFLPFIAYANKEIKRIFTSHSFSYTLEEEAFKNIIQKFSNMLLETCAPTLIAECSSQNSSYSIFSKNLKHLETREGIFKKYPVLGRKISSLSTRFFEYIEIIFFHLDSDILALEKNNFIPQKISHKINSVNLGLGDQHDGNRAVSTICISNNIVVYRPRSAPEFEIYRDFLRDSSLHNYLYSPKVINRKDHAWVEYINHCDLEEITLSEHFYKMGLLAGVAYALGSNDLHMENVVASRFGPVPIDLETILSSQPRHPAQFRKATQQAKDYLNNSALGTGILPINVSISGNDDLEVSALSGGLSTFIGEYEEIFIQNDEIRIIKSRGVTGSAKNTPQSTTKKDFLDYKEKVMEGFEHSVEKISEFAEQLLKSVSNYKESKVRIILRPTSLYDLLRKSLNHPKFMTSMLSAEKLLLSLWKTEEEDCDLENQIFLQAKLEVKSLLDGDIPRFDTKIMDSYIEYNNEIITLLECSPLENSFERIKKIKNPHHILQQHELVRDVLQVSFSPISTVPTSSFELAALESNISIDDALLKKILHQISHNFLNSAFTSSHEATWVGMVSSESSESVRLSPLGTGLFDGLAGISLSLMHCAKVLNDEALAIYARKSLLPVINDLSKWNANAEGPIGAFGGSSGLAYTVAMGKAHLANEPDEYLQILIDFVNTSRTAVKKDNFYDLGSGAAGLINVISSFIESGLPFEEECLQTLDVAVDHLIKNSEKNNGLQGIFWRNDTSKIPLGGFSHGTSGIAYSLARASQHLKNNHIRNIALESLAFDDNYFDISRGLWKDMRTENGDSEIFPVHWCHGASGIYLARALSQLILPQEEHIANLSEQAKSALITSPLPGNDSLCHGSLGNAMCLYSAGDRKTGRKYLNKSMQRILNSNFRHGLGLPVKNVPGLMLGYAGFMNALCTAIDDSLPSVLAFGPSQDVSHLN